MEEKSNNIFEKLGIDINDEKIHMDLGKIKHFMQESGDKVGSSISELDATVNQVGKK